MMTEFERLHLPRVTLCAVSSVNLEATKRALEFSLRLVRFGACKLLTDVVSSTVHSEIEIVPITPLRSSTAYSEFMQLELHKYVDTSHCLVTQWDGHVLNPACWRNEFLEYDYIGASWPQYDDGHDVGNGGFSLRSQRLMRLCENPTFITSHPEDVAIGRDNRKWLEEQGMRFASRELADLFAAERTGDLKKTFGFHGAWNMPTAIGVEDFWKIYRELNERSSIAPDFRSLVRAIGAGQNASSRQLRMCVDRLRDALKGWSQGSRNAVASFGNAP